MKFALPLKRSCPPPLRSPQGGAKIAQGGQKFRARFARGKIYLDLPPPELFSLSAPAQIGWKIYRQNLSYEPWNQPWNFSS